MAPLGTVRIVVQPDQTFRGVLHYESATYHASTELAKQAVREGVAAYDFAGMTADQLNNWYESVVGYRPQVDDASMTDEDLRALCHEVHGAHVAADLQPDSWERAAARAAHWSAGRD